MSKGLEYKLKAILRIMLLVAL